jgi:hypothetical protein
MIQAMTACPSCGGSGGGPFGRVGSAWDDETYECPRCRGAGVVGVVSELATAGSTPRPLAKGAAREPSAPVVEKRGPVSNRPVAAKAKKATGKAR